MNGKSLMMLGLAVISGLGAMYATTQMMSKEAAKPSVEMQDVLVSVRDLKMEEVLKPDMVKVVQMAKTNIPAGAFTSYQDVEDRWVQIKILEGEPIVDRKLAPKGSPAGLVSRIPKGMRAFAIEVNEHTGVSGFILPDHRVDVVQVDPTSGNSNNTAAQAETILEDVLVLASGQVFTRPEDRSIQARTVTLAVTPEQVDVLVAARSKGPLSLALRGLNDHVHQVARRPAKPAPAEVKPAPPVAPALPPPPPAPVVAEKPAEKPRYVTIHHGLQNYNRVRVGGSEGPNSEFESETEGPSPAAN